ncbi:MAG: hypothetical protein R2831_02040 [Chitinophagaceae bacterium]
MLKNLNVLSALFFLIFLQACSQVEMKSEDRAMASEASMPLIEVDSNITIRRATLELSVQNMDESIQYLQQQSKRVEGKVTHIEINSNRAFDRQVAFSKDSAYAFYQVSPQAHLSLKIPIQAADTFIQSVLNMNASIDKLMFDEEDIRDKLFENQQSASVLNNTSKIANKLQGIQQQSNYQKLINKTHYLWFDVSLQSSSMMEKNKIASTKLFHKPIYLDFMEALENGWYGMAGLITIVITLWPLWLLGFIILFIIKNYSRMTFFSLAAKNKK